jgi:predicted extracellular nuclease
VSPNTNLIQNGADAVALYVGDASAFPNDTPVTTTDLIDAIVYDTDDSDDAGLLVLLNAGQPQVNERGGGDGTGHSNQRYPNGAGGVRNTDTYAQAPPTPGAVNQIILPVINEFVFNHDGTDTHEYVEVFGNANTDYSVFTVVEIEGDGASAGLIDDGTYILSTTDANGFWTTAFLNSVFENGTVTLLLVESYTGATGQDLDTDNDGLLDVTPWTQIVDSVAVHDGGSSDHTYAAVVLARGYDGNSYTVGGASRIPNGSDTDAASDWVRNNFDGAGLPGFVGSPEFGEAFNTPAEVNAVKVTIMEIQGAGHLSPYDGGSVREVPGIVTALANSSFYMQDASGDGELATSDGILVFTNGAPTVSTGDEVFVSGTVSEYYPGGFSTGNLSITEITYPTVTVISSANPIPAATVIGSGGRVPPTAVIDDDANTSFDPTADGIDFYESMEGMLVQVNDAIAVGPTNYFGEIPVVGDNGANAVLLTPRGGIVIQSSDFNPERIILDDAILDTPVLNVGDSFTSPIVGVMDYNFGNFKLLVTESLTTAPGGLTMETTTAPQLGQVSVASFNVENLDPGDVTAKFSALAGIVVNNLLSPDIVALQEVQDNSGSTNDGVVAADQTYQMLITAIQDAGGPTYEFRDISPLDNQDGGQPGGNIRVGFLYRSDRGLSFVDRAGGDATTAISVAMGASGLELSASPGRIAPLDIAFDESRKPLAGEFMFDGRKLFVVVNHFNSKGGDDPLFGRVQPPVLDSEVQRLLQAQVVNDFVDSILALDPNAMVVVTGDLNDFQFSNPVATLSDGVLTNLVDTLPLEEQYTYIYDGNSQVLDHFLISEGVLGTQNHFVDIVHANAEYANDFRYTDHDPVVANICMDITPPTLNVSLYRNTLWPPNHRYVRVKATVERFDDFDSNVALALVSVTSNEPDEGTGDGDMPNDIMIIDKFRFDLRAERSGLGDGRVYTITYKAVDNCGNMTFVSVTVTVPHHVDKGKPAVD